MSLSRLIFAVSTSEFAPEEVAFRFFCLSLLILGSPLRILPALFHAFPERGCGERSKLQPVHAVWALLVYGVDPWRHEQVVKAVLHFLAGAIELRVLAEFEKWLRVVLAKLIMIRRMAAHNKFDM